jgi:hypothetical protein
VRQPPVMEVDDQTYLMHLSDRNSTALRPFGGLPNHLGGTVRSALALWRIGRVSVTTRRFVVVQLDRGS